MSHLITFDKKTSRLVILRTAVSVSCTIPMTGLLAWGVMIIRGTEASWLISARVSRDCATWRFISSPSKSALYGVVTLIERTHTDRFILAATCSLSECSFHRQPLSSFLYFAKGWLFSLNSFSITKKVVAPHRNLSRIILQLLKLSPPCLVLLSATSSSNTDLRFILKVDQGSTFTWWHIMDILCRVGCRLKTM